MVNAKLEFLRMTGGMENVKCAWVFYSETSFYDDEGDERYDLPVDYTDEQWDNFLKALDFDYDAGFGTQMLDGTVWFHNGNWLDRDEYDGSEWWVYRQAPKIPSVLLR